MRFLDGIMLVWRNLLRRKSRTFLTALGVAIGTAAIVGMVALAIGLKENAVRSFDNFQDITVLDIYPGWNETPGPNSQTKQLTEDSVADLKRIPGVVGVMPQTGLYGALVFSVNAILILSSRSPNSYKVYFIVWKNKQKVPFPAF
jgi:acetoin utilization transport system permease protein